MRRRIAIACLLASALAGAAGASPIDDVQSLSWLAGSWVLEDGGRSVHEVWFEPVDGVMAGLSQTKRPGRKPTVEFMTITAEPAGATFTASPDGETPTPFLLKPGLAPQEAVFENPGHDFPQRIIYHRCGVDLCARIEGVVNGRAREQAWRFTRAP